MLPLSESRIFDAPGAFRMSFGTEICCFLKSKSIYSTCMQVDMNERGHMSLFSETSQGDERDGNDFRHSLHLPGVHSGLNLGVRRQECHMSIIFLAGGREESDRRSGVNLDKAKCNISGRGER